MTHIDIRNLRSIWLIQVIIIIPLRIEHKRSSYRYANTMNTARVYILHYTAAQGRRTNMAQLRTRYVLWYIIRDGETCVRLNYTNLTWCKCYSTAAYTMRVTTYYHIIYIYVIIVLIFNDLIKRQRAIRSVIKFSCAHTCHNEW